MLEVMGLRFPLGSFCVARRKSKHFKAWKLFCNKVKSGGIFVLIAPPEKICQSHLKFRFFEIARKEFQSQNMKTLQSGIKKPTSKANAKKSTCESVAIFKCLLNSLFHFRRFFIINIRSTDSQVLKSLFLSVQELSRKKIIWKIYNDFSR